MPGCGQVEEGGEGGARHGARWLVTVAEEGWWREASGRETVERQVGAHYCQRC